MENFSIKGGKIKADGSDFKGTFKVQGELINKKVQTWTGFAERNGSKESMTLNNFVSTNGKIMAKSTGKDGDLKVLGTLDFDNAKV